MITEALLEMHFHNSLIELFSNTFGRNFLKLLKPSPQNETWVGFDQGWMHTDIKVNEMYDDLKEKIAKRETEHDRLYLAYFFQFKPVHELRKSSSLKPATYSTPYYRSELSLSPNEKTTISQHETLQRLSQIKNAHVYYACGMLFNITDIYENPVNLDRLRFVPVTSAPTGWATNSRHFITFQTQYDNSPMWCSKPTEAVAYNISQVLENQKLRLISASELLDLLREVDNVLSENSDNSESFKNTIQKALPSSNLKATPANTRYKKLRNLSHLKISFQKNSYLAESTQFQFPQLPIARNRYQPNNHE